MENDQYAQEEIVTLTHHPDTNSSVNRLAQWALIIALSVLALLLRLWNLDAVRHNIDHAYPIAQALRTLDYGEFPLVGQATSVLFANPALTGYLYLPVVALTRSALAVYLFVAALNTLAVGFTFFSARALLRREAPAFVAAFLVAVNPWVIEYSRTTWVQSLMPFFVCGLVWLIVPVLLGEAKHPARRTLAAALLATAFTQTYLLAFFVVGGLGLLLLIFWQRVPWRAALIGVAIFAAVTAAYGVGLLTNRSGNLDRVDDFASAPLQLSGEAASHAVRMATGADYAVARGGALPDAPRRQTLEQIAHWVLTAALAGGLVAVGHAVWRRTDQRDAAVIVLVWWALPVLAMTARTNPIHPFYQLLGLPMGAVLIAWGLRPLLNRRAGIIAISAGCIAIGALWTLNGLRFADATRAAPGAEGLGGLPLGDGMRVGASIRESLPAGGFMYADASEWILNSLSGRAFTVTPNVLSPQLTIFPAGGGALHLTPEDSALPDAEPVAQFPLADGRTLTLSRILIENAPLDQLTTRLDAPSEAGLTLLGYALNRGRNDRWTLITAWRVDTVSAATSQMFFGPFVHVFDASGERVAIVETTPVSGLIWYAGDIHIHRTHIANPPEGFTLQIGQYDINAQQATTFILPDGTYTQSIEIVPLDS